MFSKPIGNNVSNEVYSNIKLITYQDYINNKLTLTKYKVSDLKYFLKQHKLHVSGNKPLLITRIIEIFVRTKHAIIIQKIFRGFIVRFSNKLRGPAINDRKLCINQSDFYTLEPLSDIDVLSFFSYKDNNGFIYGFDICSLIYLMKKVPILKNPYNREVIDTQITTNIISLYKIINIIYPNHFVINNIEPERVVPANILLNQPTIPNEINDDLMNTLNDIINSNNSSPEPSPEPRQFPINILSNNNNENNNNNNNNNNETRNTNNITIRNLSRRHRTNSLPENFYQTLIFNNISNTQNTLINRLYNLKTLSIHTRIQELFIEIDLLGNYTQGTWFSLLEKREYIIFIQSLYDIWDYRANLTTDIKNNICQLCDPFRNYNPINYNFETSSILTIQKYCLDVMELMVLSGTDVEYRKLGTLYILSALTMVSIPARNNMNWLYESLVY